MKFPTLGSCSTCLPIPVSLAFLETAPDHLDNSEGDVTVIVKQTRAGGSDLRFWMMRYPPEIRSDSTAHYYGPFIGLFPDANAFAELVAVR
jgi:hypothetical protein